MESLELSLRQRNILHIIRSRSSYVTSKELAQKLKVSSRTIRNDIIEMNRILAPYNASVFSTQSKGFLFRAEDPEKIRRLSKVDTAFFSRSERIRYLAFRLCQSDDPVNLYDLEDEIFISRTALLSDLRGLKEKYSLLDPHIELLQNKGDIWFEQDELKIRSVLLNLFHEDWDYDTSGNAYYGFHCLDEDLIALLMHETPRILYRYGIRMDDPTLIALELTLAIMDYRCQSGHFYPESSCEPDTDSPAWQAAEALFSLILDQTGVSYPLSEKERIAEFISNAYVSADLLQYRKDNTNETASHMREQVTHYLDEIRGAFHVDLSGDDEFVHTLTIFLQQLMSGYTIFAQHENYRSIKELLSAEYELAYYFQRLAPGLLGRRLTDREICNLALCFSGAVRNYLNIHSDQKLKAVLFSHRNTASAWGLKRKILESFQHYIDIVDILPVNYKDNYDFSGIDLILTTVKKTTTVSAHHAVTMIINDTPSSDPSEHAMQIKFLSFRNIWPLPALSSDELFRNSYYHENAEAKDRFHVIEMMGADYRKHGICGDLHLADILDREKDVSFAFRPGIVFLYTIRPAAKTQLSIMSLKHSIRWNSYKVSTVVMAMFTKEDINLLFHLKVAFCYRSYDLDVLKKQKTREELTELIFKVQN